MPPVTLFAPAKINLGLRIIGRYASGYHHLESLFVPVALYDRLELKPAAAWAIRHRWQFANDCLRIRGLARGVLANPLLWKSIAVITASYNQVGPDSYGNPEPTCLNSGAASSSDIGYGIPELKRRSQAIAMEFHSYGSPTAPSDTNQTPAMDFHNRSYGNPQPHVLTVHKRIPSPSGLGGASADAAALLAHLLRLTAPKQASPQLLQAASKLGADIPYFLQHGLWGEPAYLSGVGAQLKPVELPQLAGIVAVPPFGFSTAAMFGYFRALDLPILNEENPPEALQSKSALRLNEIRYSDERFPGVRVAQNDFEQAAAAVFPKEAQLLSAAQAKVAQAVRQFFPGTWLAGLTGSGPALYAVTEGLVSSADLKRLSAVLLHRLGAFWQVYPIRSHRP